MKTIRHTACILFFLLITSCVLFTRHYDSIERDEFLTKFPLLNNEILGELKYDNPNLDLQTLGLDDYPDLFERMDDLTEDNKRVIKFARKNTSKQKFVVRQDTFIICIRSDGYNFSFCDDASTTKPIPDRVDTDLPLQTIDDLYEDLVGG